MNFSVNRRVRILLVAVLIVSVFSLFLFNQVLLA